jgi:hypothetical protein
VRRKYDDEKWVGRRFGRLVVLGTARKPSGEPGWLWECKCDCGKTVFKVPQKIIDGKVKSCGCLRKECYHKLTYDANGKPNRLYTVWAGMRSRCNNHNDSSYANYGGRGIQVCDEWNSYPCFYKWAMENGYDENAPKGKCTIERIDNDGNYEPSNCKWASTKEQARNKRAINKAPAINKSKHTYQILLLRLSGKTYREIGDELNISRQRVHQILSAATNNISKDENQDYSNEMCRSN